jgi:hypothetical protein
MTNPKHIVRHIQHYIFLGTICIHAENLFFYGAHVDSRYKKSPYQPKQD